MGDEVEIIVRSLLANDAAPFQLAQDDREGPGNGEVHQGDHEIDFQRREGGGNVDLPLAHQLTHANDGKQRGVLDTN